MLFDEGIAAPGGGGDVDEELLLLLLIYPVTELFGEPVFLFCAETFALKVDVDWWPNAVSLMLF